MPSQIILRPILFGLTHIGVLAHFDTLTYGRIASILDADVRVETTNQLGYVKGGDQVRMIACPICKWQETHDHNEEEPEFTQADWIIHDNEGFVVEGNSLVKVWP
jgi:hypothetical protein